MKKTLLCGLVLTFVFALIPNQDVKSFAFTEKTGDGGRTRSKSHELTYIPQETNGNLPSTYVLKTGFI